ncbi:MAG: alpha-amylase family glycosyl hydrolase [Candidatus Binatia bacterium]|nr:alpha-amylase family glycosyl hydrolase [Candidatus Binatia bacterium]
MGGQPWWKRAVVYQIYPRSFADSNGDGVGELEGIRQHLDHIAGLGADALWLSPIFRSPMRDFGYDVSDYCDIDPVFGTLADLDALVESAHARNLRVILDWVPSHTSSDHPWFLDSRSSRDAAKRSWYVWRDPKPDGSPPNNWTSAFSDGGPAWTLDEASGQYWLHSFLAEQPDLNWENPDVVAAMHDTLRFWLDRGVDGFRADVVHNIGKDPALLDVADRVAKIPHCALNDDPRTIEHLRGIRRLLDSYPGERMIVGEVFLMDTQKIAPYYADGAGLHLSFNFPPMFLKWKAEKWRDCLEEVAAAFDPVGAWPTWVLSNHDWPRHRTRLGSEPRSRAAALLLLTLRGTPFLYMGEELGLEDAVVPADRVVDPGGRDGCRAPLPWTRAAGHGWPDPAWLPLPPDADLRNVEAESESPDSMLQLYRRLLTARRASPALSAGDFELLDDLPRGVLGYRRSVDGDARIILINFEETAAAVGFPPDTTVEVSSDGAGEGAVFTGALDTLQAVLLRPTT